MYISIRTYFKFSVSTETFSKLVLLLPTDLFNKIEDITTSRNKISFTYSTSISIQGKDYISRMSSKFIQTKEEYFKDKVLALIAPLKDQILDFSYSTKVATLTKHIKLK